MAQFAARFKILIERNLSKRDHHPDLVEQAKLFYEIGTAAVEFVRGGLIVRRRTPNDGRNITVFERQTVVLTNRVRLVGKPIPVEGFIQPISTAISGKDASGPISTVCGRCQTNDE